MPRGALIPARLCCCTPTASLKRAPSGDFYGEGRMRTFLETHHGRGAETLCNELEREICRFQGMKLVDDLTILALRRIGSRVTRVLEDFFKGKRKAS